MRLQVSELLGAELEQKIGVEAATIASHPDADSGFGD